MKDHTILAIGETLIELGIPTFGLAFLLRHGGRVKGAMDNQRAHRDAAHSEITYTTDHDSHANVIAETLVAFARGAAGGDRTKRLPVIVAIEDIHLLGPDLTALVEVLGRHHAEHPVLLVGTSWLSAAAHARGDWLRLRDDMLASGRMEVWSVEDLEQSDLEKIVRAYAPNTDRALVAWMPERWPNPFCLEFILADRGLAGNIRDSGGAVRWPKEDLQSLGTNLEAIFLKIFEALALDVQRTLVLTRASLPDGPVHA